MTPVENTQEFTDQLVLVTFLFGHSSLTVCLTAYKVTKVAGRGAFKGAVIFYDTGFSAKLRSCQLVTNL